MDRRRFISVSGSAVASASALGVTTVMSDVQEADGTELKLVPQKYHVSQQQYRIGHTTGAKGGWSGHLFKSFQEVRNVGFRYVEVFGSSFCKEPNPPQGTGEPPGPYKVWPDGYVFVPRGEADPNEVYYPDGYEALQHRMFEIGLQFVAITGGELGGATDFADPSKREAVINNHFRMARFSRRFGCNHQKTNVGSGHHRAGGGTLEDLKNISLTAGLLGKRIKEELGMRFGVHAHLFSQLQNQNEIDYVMENTNPDHVGFVLDTGHVTMAGMDPLELCKKLGTRVVEYHFKDTAPGDRGGTKNVPTKQRNMMNDPYFYPLGTGGVDFPAIMEHLRYIGWRGFLTVELDASPWRPPQESARMAANYLRNVLHLEL